MKKIFFLLFLSISYSIQAQFNAIHYQRKDIFEKLPVTSNDIIFLGNSITHGGKWTELFGDIHVKNRGISGNTTDALLD